MVVMFKVWKPSCHSEEIRLRIKNQHSRAVLPLQLNPPDLHSAPALPGNWSSHFLKYFSIFVMHSLSLCFFFFLS